MNLKERRKLLENDGGKGKLSNDQISTIKKVDFDINKFYLSRRVL